MNRCLNCKLEISEKATFCSDKCRMAYTRRTKQGEQPEQNDRRLNPNIVTRTLDFEPTRTDRLFEDSKPGYYSFSDKVYEAQCIMVDRQSDKSCGKRFKSHLPLLRFCCPEHQLYTLDALTGKFAKTK